MVSEGFNASMYIYYWNGYYYFVSANLRIHQNYIVTRKRKLYCYSKKENCIVTQKSETLQVNTLHVDNEF